MVLDPLVFITGFVATKLTQKTTEVVWKRTRKALGAETPVHRALVSAVKAGVDEAAGQVYGGDEAEAVRRALLERDEAALPLVDGTSLGDLVEAVRVWVASIESPADAEGPAAVASPLVEPLCVAILVAIQDEATRGDGDLARLWDDFRHQQTQAGFRSTTEDAWQEYWNPELPATEFVGRTAELDELSAAPKGSDGVRLVCSVGGIGGVGKTALAVEYANRNAADHPDGRIYYNFHSYSSHRKPITGHQALREILPKVLGSAMPVERLNQLDDAGLEAEWRRATHDRRLIMVWDNLRDLDQIEPLLLRQPGCTTIVTSRAHLDLPRSHSLWLDTLDHDEAVELFTAIAGSAEDPAMVSRLVEADMYMAVLIGSHAKLVRTGRRALTEVLSEIEGLPRAKTAASLDERLAGSYQVLDEVEKYMFRVIGGHPSRILSAGTAAAVVGCEVEEAVELLDALHGVGLIEPRRSSGPVTGMDMYTYAGHDVIGGYAHSLAVAQYSEFQETRRSLTDYYYQRLSDYQPAEHRWLEHEYDSVLATAMASADHENLLLGAELGFKLFSISRFTDAAVCFAWAVDVSRSRRDRVGLARVLKGLGDAARLQGDFVRAQSALEESAALYQAAGDRRCHADATRSLGNVALRLAEYKVAERHLKAAISDYEDIGDDKGVANAVRSLGNVAFLRGRLDDAERYFSRSLSMHQALGDRFGYANASHGLGEVARSNGEHETAIRHFEAAIARSESTGTLGIYANATWAIGGVKADLGLIEDAREALTESAAIFERLRMDIERDRVRAELRKLDDPPPRQLDQGYRGGGSY